MGLIWENKADDDNYEEDNSSSDSFAGTNGAFKITLKIHAWNTFFLNLVDFFQYAPGVFDINWIDKTQFCCVFCPLLRFPHSKYYYLLEMARTTPQLRQCCHFRESWPSRNCYFDTFSDMKIYLLKNTAWLIDRWQSFWIIFLKH